MKTLFVVPLLLLSGIFAQAQSFLTQTSLSNAINDNVQTFPLASYTNITGGTSPTLILVDKEAMLVLSVTTSNVTVARGQSGTRAVGHISGAMVLAGPPNYFFGSELTGSCTSSALLVLPAINLLTGAQYLCSTVLGQWVAGWQNDLLEPNVTAAVASAAGLITPSGPLFHVTGTAAITGFNIPLGFAYGSFTIIPDGIFTTTTANNIALASTAVVSKPLTFTYDSKLAKFFPSY